jgi:putative salt-induced outer membrane protein
MRLKCIALLATVLIMTGTLGAEDEAAPEPSWTGDLGLSYVSTTGNTDTETLGLDLNFIRKPDPWGIEFKARITRAEEDGNLTAERYEAGVVGRRSLNERWELFAGLNGEKDQFKGFDLRAVVDAGVTYRALLGPTHQLWFDMGLAYTDEDRIEPEPDDDFFGASLAAHWEWAFSESASLRQDLSYYPNFDQSSKWRGVSNTALQASLTSRLAMKFGYEIRYENEPGFDGELERDTTDTTTRVSLVVKF